MAGHHRHAQQNIPVLIYLVHAHGIRFIDKRDLNQPLYNRYILLYMYHVQQHRIVSTQHFFLPYLIEPSTPRALVKAVRNPLPFLLLRIVLFPTLFLLAQPMRVPVTDRGLRARVPPRKTTQGAPRRPARGDDRGAQPIVSGECFRAASKGSHEDVVILRDRTTTSVKYANNDCEICKTRHGNKQPGARGCGVGCLTRLRTDENIYTQVERRGCARALLPIQPPTAPTSETLPYVGRHKAGLTDMCSCTGSVANKIE